MSEDATLRLKKVYGVTENNQLVVVNPKGTIKIAERYRSDSFLPAQNGSEYIKDGKTIDIAGNIREYHLVFKNGELFEKAARKIIDDEVSRLQAIKEIL